MRTNRALLIISVFHHLESEFYRSAVESLLIVKKSLLKVDDYHMRVRSESETNQSILMNCVAVDLSYKTGQVHLEIIQPTSRKILGDLQRARKIEVVFDAGSTDGGCLRNLVLKFGTGLATPSLVMLFSKKP